MTAEEAIEYLENWVARRTDGDWEQMNGITIENTDNPGWLITIRSRGEIPRNEEEIGTDLTKGSIQGKVTEDSMMLYSHRLKTLLLRAVEILSKREQ